MKRKPMKRERAYVVVDARDGQTIAPVRWSRSVARYDRVWARDHYAPAAYVQPVDIIPAKGRKG